MIRVNNFFKHRIKEIDIKRYRDGLQILPTIKTRDIYRYSDAILKHISPEDALKTHGKTLLFNKKRLLYQLVRIEEQVTPLPLMQLIERMKI